MKNTKTQKTRYLNPNFTEWLNLTRASEEMDRSEKTRQALEVAVNLFIRFPSRDSHIEVDPNKKLNLVEHSPGNYEISGSLFLPKPRFPGIEKVS